MSGYKRVNYYELCRLCTSTEGTKMHIFREEGRRRQLSNKIKLCLPLQVGEDDSLPKIVCSDCVEKLESFYEFRESCVNAEAMLESYFSSIRVEDQKDGHHAAVYVRDSMPPKDESKPMKHDVLPPTTTQVQAPAALVLPVGTDGISNLIQAAGIQIITDADPTRLQPLIGSSSTPTVVETSDGARYTYLNNAVPTTEVSHPKRCADSSDEVSQHSQHTSPAQSQTITFASAGQEMMVQFNLKDADATNPQLQRASIAQLGEFLKMNLVDGATLVKDPTIPGGLRIVNLPQTLVGGQPLEQQLHQQPQLHQVLQNQSLQHQELEQQHQHLQQSSVQQTQTSLKKHIKQEAIKLQVVVPQQAEQLQQQHHQPHEIQHQHISQSQQNLEIHQNQKVHHLQQQLATHLLQFGNECEVEEEISSQEVLDRHNSLCSSIEAVVSGAGGQSEDCSEGVENEACGEGAQNEDSKDTEKFMYPCEDCPKLFKRKEHLSQHQKLHTGERPYVCEHCSKTFIRKEHLFRHSISHAGTKKFECDRCGKLFSRKDNLHKHRKTHSEEGPYVCQICAKSFIVKHYYTVHMECHRATDLSDSGEVTPNLLAVPFKCELCDKAFPTKAYRDSHQSRHRKLKKKQSDKVNEENANDPTSQDKHMLDQNHQYVDDTEVKPNDHQDLQIQQNQGSLGNQQHPELQQCEEFRQMIERGNVLPVSVQTSVPTSNGVNSIIPHIIQQLGGTNSSTLIQVQSTSNGTTFICSPEVLETYRRMQQL